MSVLLLSACGGSLNFSTPSTPTATAWSNPLSISSPSGGAGEVQVAIDNAGNAIAVWLQLNSSGAYAKSLWASRYQFGSGWSNPVLIESSAADIRDFTLVMRADTGRITVIWSQLTSQSNFDIWARSFDAAGGWEAIALVENSFGEVSKASAGIDANGNTLAVWSQLQNGRFHVWSNRLVPGAGWGTPVLIETHDVVGDQDTAARIAMLSSGDAIAVWKRSTGSSTSLWTNKFRAVGGWGSESQLVADAGSAFSLDSQQNIAADGVGGALLVWGQWQFLNSQHQSTVVAKRYAAGWQAFNTDIAPPVANASLSNPFIAVNSAGVAAVLWQRGDSSLQISMASAGNNWTAPFELRPAGSLGLKGLPSTAIDDAGNVFAAWATTVSRVGQTDLFVQRYRSIGGWDSAQALHTLTFEADASSPAIAMNARGDAVLAYIETTSASGSRVVARNYSVR